MLNTFTSFSVNSVKSAYGGKKTILAFIFIILFVTLLQAQWTEQTSGVTTALWSLSAVDDNVAWACGVLGRVVRTTNGGTVWAPVTNPTSSLLYNIFGVSATIALTTSSPGGTTGTNVYRTTDGGTTWTLVFNQGTAVAFINSIWMTSAANGFMMGDPVGGRWSLWKTTNGGVNWDSTGLYLTANADAGWANGMMVIGNSIWFNSNGPRVYYSSNNGTSWNQQSITGGTGWGTIWFNSLTAGMASYNASLINTVNSGTLWTPVTTLPGIANINGITGKDNTWFVIRDANVIYKTTDGGLTWMNDYTVPNGILYYIQKALNGNRMWAVRSNGGISKSDLLTGITPVSGEIPSTYSLSQNYPNPFNPSSNIKFQMSNFAFANLKVYDVLGKEIVTLVNEQLKPGNYEVEFDGSNFPSGVYFYKLIAEDFIDTKKMLLIK